MRKALTGTSHFLPVHVYGDSHLIMPARNSRPTDRGLPIAPRFARNRPLAPASLARRGVDSAPVVRIGHRAIESRQQFSEWLFGLQCPFTVPGLPRGLIPQRLRVQSEFQHYECV